MAEQSEMALQNGVDSALKPHNLHDTWNLWAHLPHDTSWTLDSYKKIITFKLVEEIIALNHNLPDALIKNCMLFLMRDGIFPNWEDPDNSEGCCISFKIPGDKIKEEFSKIKDYSKTLKKCHSTVGVAILNTSITIVFGFSILVLSKFIPTIYFGVFTGIAMLLAMISVLTLLPALILTVKPFGK